MNQVARVDDVSQSIQQLKTQIKLTNNLSLEQEDKNIELKKEIQVVSMKIEELNKQLHVDNMPSDFHLGSAVGECIKKVHHFAEDLNRKVSLYTQLQILV